MLVGHRLAVAHAGIGGDHQLGLGVVDAHRQVVGGKTAKHHRVDRAQPDAGQHREQRFGDHRHVDDHPVALLQALRLHHCGEAVHFAVQVGIGVGQGFLGLGRDIDHGRLIGAFGEVTVDGVVAEVGFTTHKPLPKRRIVILQHLLWRLVPVNQLGLLTPEAIRVFDRPAMEFFVTAHAGPPAQRFEMAAYDRCGRRRANGESLNVQRLTRNCAPAAPAARGGRWARGLAYLSRSAMLARSSRSSCSVASIFSRLNSSTGRPWTIS